MTEYGLFNDEGLVEDGFRTEQEALDAIADRYSPEDELTVEKLCHEHPENADSGCEDCYGSDE